MDDASAAAVLAFLKNPTSAQALIFFAFVTGAIVRVLKTKTVSELLDAAPPDWIKRVPKWLLPYLALVIGFAVTTLNAKLNAHKAWPDSLLDGLMGLVVSGGTAIGGHETIGKLVGLFLYKPKGPINQPAQLPGPDAPPVGANAMTPAEKADDAPKGAA